MFRGIDLYSDTATRPSEAMKKAMFAAEVGDEQMGEDPTTLQLESKIADLLGKDAAMFFPTATMANEIALMAQSERGDELICWQDCHLIFAETGGPAVHAGLMTKVIDSKTGIFTADQVKSRIGWERGPHFPNTRIVAVENTTNMAGGIAWPMATLKEVAETAKEAGLVTHMDGARFYNAVVKSNVTPEEMAQGFDSVTICLSKALGCPSGAVLVYPKALTERIRRLKQLMGGAMRQSGILAAAGIYALENNVERIADDHANAERLASLLVERVPGVEVENPAPSTNMVFFHLKPGKLTPQQFDSECVRQGLRFSHVGATRFRAVTHIDIQRKDIDAAVQIIQRIL
jgi:threonine aldolase